MLDYLHKSLEPVLSHVCVCASVSAYACGRGGTPRFGGSLTYACGTRTPAPYMIQITRVSHFNLVLIGRTQQYDDIDGSCGNAQDKLSSGQQASLKLCFTRGGAQLS